MPATTSSDDGFSYDRDISPYASRYFDSIGNDPRLSHERKMQLKGTLLDGVEDIKMQRLKMQEEKDNGVMRTLKMQGYQSDLEDARAKRIQMQRDTEAIGGAKTRVNSILGDTTLSSEQKRQLLAQEELNHPLAGDQTLGRVFNLGREALPKEQESMFTPSQQVEFLSKVANSARPEDAIAALRNPAAMAQLRDAAEAQEKEDKEADELQGKKDAEAHELRKNMTRTRFKFAEDDTGMVTGKLDDDSSRNAELVVRALAPDKLKDFVALRQAGDDKAIVQFVESIQDSKLDEILNGKSKGAAATGFDRTAARNAIFRKKE